MSEEQKEPIPENTNNSSEKASPEEERKKQFERMKEKFKKQNSPFGGNKNSNNNGNNFYWIYAAVIGVLLFIVFYGNNFNSHLIEVSQGEFYQKMLSKGDVKDIVIVNKTIARISINPDSAYKCDRYKNDKGVSIFPDKNFKSTLKIKKNESYARRIRNRENDILSVQMRLDEIKAIVLTIIEDNILSWNLNEPMIIENVEYRNFDAYINSLIYELKVGYSCLKTYSEFESKCFKDSFLSDIHSKSEYFQNIISNF